MGQSLAAVYVHLIFSTNGRIAFLGEHIQPRLWQYMGGICKTLNCVPIQIGGMSDHVHVLCVLSRDIAMKDLVSRLKSESTNWLKSLSSEYSDFSWQAGYGAFSVNPTETEKVISYITNQKQHHTTRDFCNELRAFLEKYSIEYNEKYLWN